MGRQYIPKPRHNSIKTKVTLIVVRLRANGDAVEHHLDDSSRFVWYSTPESISLGIPSALGAFEVFVSVGVWWACAIYFDTFFHLWMSICVAPWLLLRSKESTSLGVLWISKYLKSDLIQSSDYRSGEQSPLTRTALATRVVLFFLFLLIFIWLSLEGSLSADGFWTIVAVSSVVLYSLLISTVMIAGIIRARRTSFSSYLDGPILSLATKY